MATESARSLARWARMLTSNEHHLYLLDPDAVYMPGQTVRRQPACAWPGQGEYWDQPFDLFRPISEVTLPIDARCVPCVKLFEQLLVKP